MRVVSEVTESNGGLHGNGLWYIIALMDAGVPSRPVAGIAMGLIKEGEDLRCSQISWVMKITR